MFGRRAAAIPLDRERVLEVSDRPRLARALRRARPWVTVESHPPASPLPFEDGAFDCVVLADAELRDEALRVLDQNGLLLSAGGERTWKSAAHDTGARARQISDWLYRHVQPGEGGPPTAKGVLKEQVALCEGYALAGRDVFEHEGFPVRWITMVAEDVPWQDRHLNDSHEVLEVEVDGQTCVVDPTANIWYEASLAEILRDPERATVPAQFDDRATQRGYELYTGPNWYGNVKRVAVRTKRTRRPRFVSVERFLADSG